MIICKKFKFTKKIIQIKDILRKRLTIIIGIHFQSDGLNIATNGQPYESNIYMQICLSCDF